MLHEGRPVHVDKWFIEQMIERCFANDQYLKVKDDGGNFAELRYGTYRYRTKSGQYTQEKKLRSLKHIFHSLINKHKNFEHEGYLYCYSRGEWRKYQL